MKEAVIFKKQGRVGIVTLNRPEKANTISDGLVDGILAAIEAIEEDDDIRAVVVTGAGKHFCGGADLKELSPAKFMATSGTARLGIEFDQVSKPVIAAINGAAMGGGCEIALTCDFRFIDRTAKIGLPEINFGALPAAGGTVRLPRIVGPSAARRLIMTGRSIDAEEAHAIGLVDVICDEGSVLESSIEFAERELVNKAPFAIRTAKSLIGFGMELELDEALLAERQAIAGMATPEEMQEARRKAASGNATYARIFSDE